jgi:hypothetical protein
MTYMSTELTSRIVGPLTEDESISEWLKSDAIAIPFFDNKKLAVTFMDLGPEDLEEADAALRNFFALTSDDRLRISDLAYKNYTDFLDEVDFDGIEEGLSDIKEDHEIWNFIYPTDIYVSKRHRRDHDVYVCISCECGWEEEHGLQLVFRQGKKLTRISSEDGHLTEADAYDKPDAEDELLSKF